MDEDMEDYGFEYDTDEELQPEDVDIENAYYNAKGQLENGELSEALDGFQSVVGMEDGKGEWGFKALKQIVKIYFKRGDFSDMMDAYRSMLMYMDSGVTRNQFEKKTNSLLDTISQSNNSSCLQEFYEVTLQVLAPANNERLWFKANLKLCQLLFQTGDYGRMTRILKDLHKSCEREDGTPDLKKGTQLLEVYALEIQMFTEQKNNKKLKELHKKALTVKGAIPHPRILGIVQECGGKMHMHDKNWSAAATDFFEAFKCYDEAGIPRRVQCLKYLVLATMLTESKVDPFDSQEAKPYKTDPEILAMTNLVQAYQNNNINEFERILRSNRQTIMDDPFIRQYIEDLLKNIRTQVLLELIKPYTRLTIPFMSQKVNIPEDAVEALLVSLILDNRIAGAIDQVNGILELKDKKQDAKKYAAIDKWSKQLSTIHETSVNRLVV